MTQEAQGQRGNDSRGTQQISKTPHLGGKVSLRLKLFKEGGQEESGEEENDRPEKNIWDVGPMMTTCRTLKFPFKFRTHLEEKENEVSVKIGS